MEKCQTCKHWKTHHNCDDHAPGNDYVCALCQVCFYLSRVNDLLEEMVYGQKN